MRNHLFIVSLLILSLGCTQPNPEAEKAGVEATIKGFYAALEKFDFATLGTYCTKDFHAVEDGKNYNSLDDLITMMKSMEVTTAQINMDFVKTDVGIDMANSIVKFNAIFKTVQSQMNLKTVENYILKKVDGKWLIDFYQSTYLIGPPKLEKGSVLGFHIMKETELKPGVTKAQVEDFILNKYIPSFNALSEDIKAISLKGLRGDNPDVNALIFYFTSDDVRNKYWASEGTPTEKGQAMFESFKGTQAEMDKLFTIKKDIYTDWRVE